MSEPEIRQGGNQVSSYCEILEHAEIDGVKGKKVFPIILPPTAQTNPSLSVTETQEPPLTTKTLTKTIGEESYVKTVIINSNNNSVSVSEWSKV